MAKNRILLLIIIGGLALRLVFLFMGVYDTYASDDAFYYFTIAKNIADGHGVTFDRIAPTNGFHPLWLLTLIPLYKLFGASAWPPIHLAFFTIIILDLLSGFLIYKIVNLITSRKAALLSIFFWLFSPVSLFIAALGMEASMATMLSLLSLYLLIKILTNKNGASLKLFILLGLSVGLMILARTDLTLLYSIFLAVALYLLTKKYLSLQKLLLLFFIPLLIVLPWLLWNWFNFGTLWQTSALAKLEVIKNTRLYTAGFWPTRIFKNIPSFLGPAIRFYYLHRLVARSVIAAEGRPQFHLAEKLIAIVLIIFLIFIILERIFALFFKKTGPSAGSPQKTVFISIGLYLILHFFVFTFIIQSYWPWYYLTPFAFLSILAGPALNNFVSDQPKVLLFRKTIVIISLFAITIISINTAFQIKSPQRYEKEIYLKPRLQWINKNIPPYKILGVFNAGTYGYFITYDTQLKLVNLDLLVNNQGLKALQSGEYTRYIISTIDYLAEDPSWFLLFLNQKEQEELMLHFKKIPSTTGIFYQNIYKK